MKGEIIKQLNKILKKYKKYYYECVMDVYIK